MIKLRIATPKDGAALAEIYAYYVAKTAVSFEYDAPDAEEFSRRIAHKLEKHPFIVAEKNGKPVVFYNIVTCMLQFLTKSGIMLVKLCKRRGCDHADGANDCAE